MNTDVNILLAFGAGVLSFISPCTLPLYPAFLSYITGMTLDELKNEKGMLQKRAILHTIAFLLGFSVIFIMLGLGATMSATFIEKLFLNYQDLMRQLGAILIIFFGLMIVGLLQIPFLMKDHKIQFKNRPSGYFGSGVIGFAFAAGWTPCSGPILAAILALVASTPEMGVPYMMAYYFGFAIPFFVLSFFISKLSWIRRNSQKIVKVGGYIMIAVGILLFFDGLTYIITLLEPITGGFTGF